MRLSTPDDIRCAWTISSPVQVWSDSGHCWCQGTIVDIQVIITTRHLYIPISCLSQVGDDGEWLLVEHIRKHKSVHDRRVKQVGRYRPHVCDPRASWDVGTEVEVWSETLHRWAPGKVICIEPRLPCRNIFPKVLEAGASAILGVDEEQNEEVDYEHWVVVTYTLTEVP